MHVTKQCRLRFGITVNFVDEVELDVIPLDICGVVLGSPYLYDRDAIFHRKENSIISLKMELNTLSRHTELRQT